MNIEALRDFCLSLPGTEEKMPFDNRTLVFTVRNKMFCLTDVEDYEMINIKCDPEEVVSMREQYPEVIPGYHMNKKHWNSVRMTGKIPDHLIRTWIQRSYDLVVRGLPKRDRDQLKDS